MITNSSSSDNLKSVKGSKNASSSGSGGGQVDEEKKDRSSFKSGAGSKEFREPRGRGGGGYYAYCTSGRGRGKSRGRRDDYGRGGGRFYEDQRRGTYRGRSRRGRDDVAASFSRSRFQESLNKNNKSDVMVSTSSSKFYSGDYRGNKSGIPEDSKISSTLRRMTREDDEATFNTLCKLLQESMTLSDNEVYIRRAMDIIGESLLDIVRFGSEWAKVGASTSIGHLAHRLGSDVKRFLDWIFRKFNHESNSSAREYLLKGLRELAMLDMKYPKLGDCSKPLMKELHKIMETTDAPDIYMLSAETILILTKRYPYHFTDFFHDAIDIVVGWLIDSPINGAAATFSSNYLRSLSPYWMQDVCFTVNLLGQLLEDAESCADELLDPTDEEPFAKATSFISVFRAVFEGAREAMDPSKCKQITWTFHSDTIARLFGIVLKMNETLIFCPLIEAGNRCACSIMVYLRYKTDQMQTILADYLSQQLKMGDKLKPDTLSSFLGLLAKVMSEPGIHIPSELVDQLFSTKSFLLTLRFTSLVEELYPVYWGLLKRKDIYLIKSAYYLILIDLESALRVISPPFELLPVSGQDQSKPVNNIYTVEQVPTVVSFYFEAFKQMSQTGGSLIWIHLLKPTLFELLAVKLITILQPIEYPALYHSLIVLLKSHCSLYGEFVSTSGLTNASQGRPSAEGLKTLTTKFSNSPTTNHLATILNIIGEALKMVMSEDTKVVVTKWSRQVILACLNMAPNELGTSREVWFTVAGLCRAATDTSRRVAIAAARAIKSFTAHCPPQAWRKDFTIKVIRLCTFFIHSPYVGLQKKYLTILPLLPTLEVVFGVENICKDPKSYSRNLEMWLYSAMNRGDTGEIQESHFRRFMAYVLHGVPQISNKEWLAEVVYRCWAVTEFEIGQRIMGTERGMAVWAVWHCSQYTSNGKLKTPFGKPAQTLITIESAFRELSKEVVSQKASKAWRWPMTAQRVRLLVDFVENLEKQIYNNIEGTSSALPVPPQGIKSFFITNKATCTEWLNRIRLTVMFVCIHAGMSTSAVRHGFSFLQHLVDSNDTQCGDFETGLIYTGWALCNLREGEAVRGLYAWARDSHGTKMPVLKPLALKAQSRYEDALVEFQNLLNTSIACEANVNTSDSEQETPSNSIRTFIADQLTETYICINEWDELLSWKKREKEYLSEENGNSLQLYKALDEEYVKALHDLDTSEIDWCSRQLSDWKTLKVPNPGRNAPQWNLYSTLGSVEAALSKITINAINDPVWKLSKNIEEKIESWREVIDDLVKECCKEGPSEVLGPALVLKYAFASLSSDCNYLDNQLAEMEGILKKKLRSPELSRLLWWLTALRGLDKRVPTSDLADNINLLMCRVARKEGNPELARISLTHHLKMPALNNLLDLYKQTTTIPFANKDTRALKQLAKQLYGEGEKQAAVEVALSSACIGDKMARSLALIRAGKWIALNDLASRLKEPIIAALKSAEASSDSVEAIDLTMYMKGLDDPVGRLFAAAAGVMPTVAKAWSALAGWALEAAGSTPSLQKAVSVPIGIPMDVVVEAITDTPPKMYLDDIDMDGTQGLKAFLNKVADLGELSQELIDTLVAQWRAVHTPVFNCFTLAAYSYFKFLNHQTSKSSAVLATLRLVRLLCHHPVEMEPIFQVMMPLTPTEPWVSVAPQLFSRLSHPHFYPRRKTAELLVRIGIDFPHLITFPAVVGSSTGASTIKDMPNTKLFVANQQSDNGDLKDDEMDDDLKFLEDEEDTETYDDDELTHNDESSSILESSFKSIVDSLSKQCGGEMLSEVSVFVAELRRITVLWDELWLGTLKQRFGDIVRRFNKVSAEVEVTLSNHHLDRAKKDSLILEKHCLILKPLLFVLEQLHSVTSVPAETPHETQFQEKFGSVIEETLRELQEPTDPRNPEVAYSAIKRLEKALSQASENGGKPMVYNMCEISPILANMKDTMISMPGLPTLSVTIARVVNTVPVLATMTKPKKLVFVGSDGKEYTYLFKGLEDLHLDERIMQFLSTANKMLPDPLRAVHYSVVPLGPRSGLISWVESVTPIFSIYKRWQHNQAKPGCSGGPATSRPSELFYSVLTPLLQDVGLKAEPQHRATWPLYIMKKALSMLMTQTPTYLLSKEMWCMSGSCGSWWEATKLYSTSLAVMSMIGYIIGLGDRHLDNILVNLRTGQVVHIDYNVCFEKGKTLRVPEKVPFRLTPNLVNALGLTGIEGLFRLTSEKVLDVLQKEKETLLTLLEAFVYDPLIDWTPMHEAGYTGAVYGGGRGVGHEMKQSRRQLEREVTLAMYSVLVVEILHEWNANKLKIETELKEFINLVSNWLEGNHKLGELMSQLQERHSQMAYLKEAEGQPQHALFTLGSRYEKFINTVGLKAQVTSSLEKTIAESDVLLTHYQRAIDLLRMGEVAKWKVQVTNRPTQDICTVFDLIKEFLQNAGQGFLVSQCADSEVEVSKCCRDFTKTTLMLIDLLLRYWEVAENYPPSYILSHRSHLFKKWACMLLENKSDPCCTRVNFDMSAALAVREEEVIIRSRYYSDLVMLGSSPSAVPPLPSTELFSPSCLTSLSSRSLASAVAAEIINISSAILKLELTTVGSPGSGEVLASLIPPQDADEWFLEDVVALTGAIRELVCLLPAEKDSPLYFAARQIGIIHSKYKSLQMLDLNVRSIIVNEAIRLVKIEDQSVIAVQHLLEEAVAAAKVPTRDLVDALASSLSLVINGSKPSEATEAALSAVERQEEEIGNLLSALEAKHILTPGEMLLLGFAGLFAPLIPPSGPPDLQLLPLNPPWNDADTISNSSTYAVRVASACDSGFVCRLLCLHAAAARTAAIADTLALCRVEANNWATACHPPSDSTLLAGPARAFINQIIRLRLAGLISTTTVAAVSAIVDQYNLMDDVAKETISNGSRIVMEDICEKIIRVADDGKRGQEMVHHMAAVVRRQQALEHREQEAATATASQARMAIARTTYFWLYEQYLLAGPVPLFNRSGWSAEVGKNLLELCNIQTELKESLYHQDSLISTVGQRLRWAAGANPALNEVLSAFEESVSTFRKTVDQEISLGAEVAGLANCVIQYEGLRGHNEDTMAADSSFAMLVKECLKAYNASCSWYNEITLTSLEEGLTALCAPPHDITPEWTTKAEAVLSEVIQQVTEKVDPLQRELFAAKDCIKSKAMLLRFEMSKRSRIASDVRQLFKTMVKFEDAGEMGLEKYLDHYKEYTDRMSKMTKRFTLPEAFGEKQLQEVLDDAEILLFETNDVYDGLLKFSFRDDLQGQHTVSDGGKKRKMKKLVHAKSVQEKNLYAVSVWRRIKMKLEGRDPDPGVPSSVHHQVRWAIDEAMSADNLATLYEGWTPWV